MTEEVFEEILTVDKKQIILKYLRKNAGLGLSQGNLARSLQYELGYKTEISCRVSIAKLLKQMEVDGLISYKTEKPVRGYIFKKVWYVIK